MMPACIPSTTASRVERAPSLGRMRWMWFRTVTGLMPSELAISSVDCPVASCASTSRSRGLSGWSVNGWFRLGLVAARSGPVIVAPDATARSPWTRS